MSEHKWYAIQSYSGSELSVKNAIKKLVQDLKIEDRLADIIVPTEDVIEVKKGKQKVVERCLYPGYVFAKLDLDTDLWHKIQSLSKVSRFIGEQKKPAPLGEKDIELIIEKVNKREAPKPKVYFDTTEAVRIIDGPFANFTGVVEEYDMVSGRLRLNVSIFGRSTPVEIMYNQVEKIV
ncbi:MAG: transcription termination/antitermination protein NusG [Helicobacteraceae bacterium]